MAASTDQMRHLIGSIDMLNMPFHYAHLLLSSDAFEYAPFSDVIHHLNKMQQS